MFSLTACPRWAGIHIYLLFVAVTGLPGYTENYGLSTDCRIGDRKQADGVGTPVVTFLLYSEKQTVT